MTPRQNVTKYCVGVLGATGTVGQRFVELLASHPWFTITAIGASERSVGKTYVEAVVWRLPTPIPQDVRRMVVRQCKAEEFINECDLVFSGLDASVAGPIEEEMASFGLPVFSNAKNHRYDPTVPILVPLINADHLDLVRDQPHFSKSGGFIVTNANCSSTGLAIALAPIVKAVSGQLKVVVATLQAISGAGYPGVPSLDILDNVIPFIGGEEEKIEQEPKKILGTLLFDGRRRWIEEAKLEVSAMCHRVAVTDGHTLSVTLEFPKDLQAAEQTANRVQHVLSRISSYEIPNAVTSLPSCPKDAILVLSDEDRPQPKLDRNAGNGMTTVVGRIRPCRVHDVKLTIVSHNTVVGAAGGSVLNAELAVAKGFISRRKFN